MCGIAGVMNLSDRHAPPALELLGDMIAILRHRGPDGFGVYRDETVGMANARLAIVDIETGWQPIANEDETVWIVFNGEIFNHLDLRRELEGTGHRFRTRSDTETIVHAYEQWGTGAFARFNGDWALAIWDTRRRRLVLSRDRVGVRPLFYREGEGRLWFGSEVKAIFADPAVPRRFDRSGLEQVFTFWSTIAPATVFEGIMQLPPASIRIYNADGGIREERYWEPEFPAGDNGVSPKSLDDAARDLKNQLDVATRMRLAHAEVPVGAYLSGGLDSSTVVALAKGHARDTFRSLSVRFTLDEFDETVYQEMAARQIHRDHHSILVRPEDIAEVFPEVVWHCETPILRTAPAPLYLLSREARKAGLKVVLTGEGADEFLCGYDIFKEAKILSFWAHQPESEVRPMLFNRLYKYMLRGPRQSGAISIEFWRAGLGRIGDPQGSHYLRWRSTSGMKRFLVGSAEDWSPASVPIQAPLELPRAFDSWGAVSRAQYLEAATLLPGYILSSQGDRMMMAHSVEGRFPFLDPGVIDASNMLSETHKICGLNEKAVLKRAMRDVLPKTILTRTKQPYRSPDAASFLGSNASARWNDLLSPQSIGAMGIFQPEMVQALIRKCTAVLNDRRPGRSTIRNSDNMAFMAVLSTALLWNRMIASPMSGKGEGATFVVQRDRTQEKLSA